MVGKWKRKTWEVVAWRDLSPDGGGVLPKRPEPPPDLGRKGAGATLMEVLTEKEGDLEEVVKNKLVEERETNMWEVTDLREEASVAGGEHLKQGCPGPDFLHMAGTKWILEVMKGVFGVEVKRKVVEES